METKIWIRDSYCTIKPDDPVNSTKRVHSFCCSNALNDRLFKSQGGYYILKNDGKLYFLCRTLNGLTFQVLYDELKKADNDKETVVGLLT